METYNIEDLKKEVRITLDQNTTGGQLVTLDDIDALMLESIIENKLVDAARIVESNAPVHMLGSGIKMFESYPEITWGENNDVTGAVDAPDDFLRLVVFKMSDWKRPVVSIISIADPLYARQKSRFAGVRGCTERPIVAIVPTENGQALEFYSCSNQSATVELAQYIPIPSISESKISLCEKLKSSIVYYTAYLVSLSVGENELAGTLKSTAEVLMQ